MDLVKSGVYRKEDILLILGDESRLILLLEKGIIQEVSPNSDYFYTSDIRVSDFYMLLVQKYFPNAIISKSTILSHYSLIGENSEQIDLDFLGDASIPKNDKIFQFHISRRINDPVVMEKVNGVEVRCYSVERAVFEVLFLEDKDLGLLAGEVAFNYVRNHPYNAEQLRLLANTFGERGAILFRLIQLVERGLSPY